MMPRGVWCLEVVRSLGRAYGRSGCDARTQQKALFTFTTLPVPVHPHRPRQLPSAATPCIMLPPANTPASDQTWLSSFNIVGPHSVTYTAFLLFQRAPRSQVLGDDGGGSRALGGDRDAKISRAHQPCNWYCIVGRVIPGDHSERRLCVLLFVSLIHVIKISFVRSARPGSRSEVSRRRKRRQRSSSRTATRRRHSASAGPDLIPCPRPKTRWRNAAGFRVRDATPSRSFCLRYKSCLQQAHTAFCHGLVRVAA